MGNLKKILDCLQDKLSNYELTVQFEDGSTSSFVVRHMSSTRELQSWHVWVEERKRWYPLYIPKWKKVNIKILN